MLQRQDESQAAGCSRTRRRPSPSTTPEPQGHWRSRLRAALRDRAVSRGHLVVSYARTNPTILLAIEDHRRDSRRGHLDRLTAVLKCAEPQGIPGTSDVENSIAAHPA